MVLGKRHLVRLRAIAKLAHRLKLQDQDQDVISDEVGQKSAEGHPRGWSPTYTGVLIDEPVPVS